jgi:hypothetical protein
MSGFVLFATPWWVNLLILAPAVPYLLSRREKIRIGRKRLLVSALFGAAFGFVEAAVVVYLRAALGLLQDPPTQVLAAFPEPLLRIECVREAATIIMLGCIALLVAQRLREKAVVFLWTFAFWDFTYYVWLRMTIGWPTSLLNSDLLFLIPVPWVAQVWFPMLVSALTAVVIWIRSE